MNNTVLTATPLDAKFADSIAPENRGTATSALALNDARVGLIVKDATLHDANFAFYTSTLQKLHETTYKPKANVTYSRDIPIKTGGGFCDNVAYYKVDYSGIMSEFRNMIGNNTNYIPRINAGMTREMVPVFTWATAYDLRFVDLEKMKQNDLGESIQQIYQTGLSIGWDLFVQHVAYVGMNGVPGLFNSDDKVEKITIDNDKTTGYGFEGMDDTAVVSFFNGIFNHYLINSNMNITVLPDTILVPSFVGQDLSGRFSALYTDTLRDFLKEHNLGIDESEGTKLKVTIASRPDLDKLNDGKGRIVAYRKDPEYVRLDLPYPMQHYITLPNIEKFSYTSAFIGQVSAIQMPYNSSDSELGGVTYWDFTTKVED